MNAVVQFQAPRLPWAPAIEERFGSLGVTKTSWKALTEAVWPTAKTVDGVVLALSYCQARNLDPFKKPVHVVPVWSSALGREVEGVWPGISELRTTAMRTANYAGCDETAFGPDITREFAWSDKKGQHKATVTYPEWAQVTVYRLVGPSRVPFVGPKVFWTETYATANRSTDAPNEMWRKRPRGQIDKCAEAAALRKAFPEELGNEYAAEEMAGRVIGADVSVATPQPKAPPTTLHADFDEPAPPLYDPETGEIADAEFTPNPETPAADDADQGGEQPAPPSEEAAPQPDQAQPEIPGMKRGSDLLTDKKPARDGLSLSERVKNASDMIAGAADQAAVDKITGSANFKQLRKECEERDPEGALLDLDYAVDQREAALALESGQ
jgi:phage recombination protein Bet